MSGLRHALRSLRRTPAVTALAILSLALSIGATAAVFGVLNALLFRTVAAPRPHELVAISAEAPDYADTRLPLDALRYFAADSTVFSNILGWQGDYPLMTIEANGVRYASAVAQVTGDYFETLEIRPALGRFFTAADREPVAVIDYRCWQRRFSGAADVLGRAIQVDGRTYSIIGVSPKNFTGLEVEVAPEVTIALPSGAASRMALVARLRPGVTVDTARARAEALWHAIPAADPARRIRVQPFATGFSFLRDRQGPALRLLLALAAAVLLIACLNLANLMLARSAARRHELGIRIALGASRARLIRPVLVESLLLSAAGGALGLVFAARAAQWLTNLLWTGVITTALDPTPDLRVAVFTAALSLAAGVVFGLAPARGLYRIGARPIARPHRPLDGLLVTAQVALSLVLVAGALLLVRTLHDLRTTDPGFRRDHLIMVRLFPRQRDPIPNRAVYYRELAEAVGRLPGVDAISYSGAGPVAPGEMLRSVGGAPAVVDFTSPGFFQKIGMRLLAGREFSWTDDESSPPIAIVSDKLAQRLFGSSEATIGRSTSYEGKPVAIVGVVSSASLWSPRTHDPLALYFPLLQDPKANGFWLNIRTAGDPALLADPVRRTLDAAGRHIALSAQTLDARLDMILARERMTTALATFLGALAVLLAAVGIYGVTWNAVARRTPELGVRMALGAPPQGIAGLVVAGVLRQVGIGAAAGIPLSLWSAKWISSLMAGVDSEQPAILAAAIGVLAIAALVAAARPAVRAAKLDPLRAIRGE